MVIERLLGIVLFLAIPAFQKGPCLQCLMLRSVHLTPSQQELAFAQVSRVLHPIRGNGPGQVRGAALWVWVPRGAPEVRSCSWLGLQLPEMLSELENA